MKSFLAGKRDRDAQNRRDCGAGSLAAPTRHCPPPTPGSVLCPSPASEPRTVWGQEFRPLRILNNGLVYQIQGQVGAPGPSAQSTSARERCACTQQLRLRLCPPGDLCLRRSLRPQSFVFVCYAAFVSAAPPSRKRFPSKWGLVAQIPYVPKPPLKQDQQAGGKGLTEGGSADTSAWNLPGCHALSRPRGFLQISSPTGRSE